jgi:photosystem II stability/assembly factor-like uncharacterized protein
MVQSALDASTLYGFSDYSPTRIVRTADAGATWTIAGTLSGMENCSAMGVGGRLYAGGGGEFYYSTDGGATWTTVACTNVYFYDLAPHPTSSSTVYATGFVVSGSSCCIGFMQSSNGGTSWSSVAVGPANSYGYSIALSPTNPSVMFISGYAYTGSTYVPRVIRSLDGGATWTDVTPAAALSESFSYSTAVSPVDQNLVLFATMTGIYRSINCGAAWTRVATGLENPSGIEFSRADPSLVMCCGDSVVYRSANSGQTWSTVPTGVASGKGTTALVLHRTASTLAYLGSSAGLSRSTDAGQSWSLYNGGLHIGEILAFGVTPTQPSRIFLQVAAQGIWRTTDNGSSWTRLTTPLECGDFCGITVGPTDPNRILALEGFG